MVLFLFPNISGIIFQVMENRLFSSTQGKQDLSVVSRLTEYDVVIHKIAENPLGGNGLGKEFHFLNPISTLTVHTTFTHNGYLYFSYRLGIPLFLFYLFSLLYNFFISLRLSWNTKNDFTRVVSLSAMGWILILIISDFSTTQFMMRDGIFVTALAYGMTAIANNWEYGNNKIPEKKLLPDLNG
jgi:O-antigen ligase